MIGKSIKQHIARGLAVAAVFTGTFTFQPVQPSTEVQGAIARTASTVNFRVGPSTNYSVIQKLGQGTIIDVVSHSANWSKVTESGRTGYLSTKYIDFTSTGFITGRVNLRTWGSSTAAILIKIPAGATVKVLSGPVNGWYKVIWNSLTGYIYKNYVMVEEIAVVTAPPAQVPVEAPVQAPAVQEPVGTGLSNDAYTLAGPAATYINAADAKNQINSIGSYSPGTYYLFKSYNGMHNVSKTPGEAGAWINPEAVSAPAPAPLYAATYEGYTKMTWTFSFYTNLPQENGGYTRTALGTNLRYGVLSSNYWPLRSQVILPEWGSFTVEDRGGPNLDSKYRFDMVIPRNAGESDYEYLTRVNQMGIKSISGYIKPFQ